MLKQLSAEPRARRGEGGRANRIGYPIGRAAKDVFAFWGCSGTATTLAYRRQSPGVRINAHSVTQATPAGDENQGGREEEGRFEERWQILWEKAMTTAEAETKKKLFHY